MVKYKGERMSSYKPPQSEIGLYEIAKRGCTANICACTGSCQVWCYKNKETGKEYFPPEVIEKRKIDSKARAIKLISLRAARISNKETK